MILFADAVYYANWLSVVYSLKDRLLKNLLVFSSKIEDLTFLTLVCLQTEGKRGKSLSFALKSPFRKDKAYRWLFLRMGLQNQRWIHGFFLGGCGLIRGESCFAFELGFWILLQPKEKIGRYGSARLWRSHFFFSLC